MYEAPSKPRGEQCGKNGAAPEGPAENGPPTAGTERGEADVGPRPPSLGLPVARTHTCAYQPTRSHVNGGKGSRISPRKVPLQPQPGLLCMLSRTIKEDTLRGALTGTPTQPGTCRGREQQTDQDGSRLLGRAGHLGAKPLPSPHMGSWLGPVLPALVSLSVCPALLARMPSTPGGTLTCPAALF